MMKFIYAIFLIFIAVCTSRAQENIFSIKEVVDSTMKKKSPEDFNKAYPAFFEDNDYVVRKTCSGEWGGSIIFKNKKTGIEYCCSSTCPVVVNKLFGKYIVTNTLAHLSGSSEIIEIENPSSMSPFQLSKPRKVKGKKIRYVGDDESKSVLGTRKLVDSIGVLTLASFLYKEELFHIITDFHKTFLAKIQNGKFVTMNKISDKSIWTYNPAVIKTVDDRNLVFFENEEVNGYLEIFGNEITLIRYK
ncbi:MULTISPECIES: hypothetical protein [unclassified Pedobacter]|uniref:hypothetical protein n=1 Tax=unclassified Pedobacter TaxID=2628915 RepID=UPI0011B2412C|nr:MULTISPECIES: hypothetical protein [unclassified Pedobacter]HWW38564.1 hypothetical protein [Pedobacter sp.]